MTSTAEAMLVCGCGHTVRRHEHDEDGGGACKADGCGCLAVHNTRPFLVEAAVPEPVATEPLGEPAAAEPPPPPPAKRAARKPKPRTAPAAAAVPAVPPPADVVSVQRVDILIAAARKSRVSWTRDLAELVAADVLLLARMVEQERRAGLARIGQVVDDLERQLVEARQAYETAAALVERPERADLPRAACAD